jgi:hypothetical protein
MNFLFDFDFLALPLILVILGFAYMLLSSIFNLVSESVKDKKKIELNKHLLNFVGPEFSIYQRELLANQKGAK